MSPFRSPIAVAALFFLLILLARGAGAPMMGWWGPAWILPRLFFPLLVIAGIAFVARSRVGWRGHDRRSGAAPAPDHVGKSPEDILRDRFARGELSRDQYRDSIVDLLKDRYVRDEITLEEYEARVDAVMDVTHRPSQETAGERQTGQEVA